MIDLGVNCKKEYSEMCNGIKKLIWSKIGQRIYIVTWELIEDQPRNIWGEIREELYRGRGF